MDMIDTMTAAEATEYLRAHGVKISPTTIREGIRQGAFPFGSIVMDGEKVKWCYIWRTLLDKWIKEREAA